MIEDEIKKREYKQFNSDTMQPKRRPSTRQMPKMTGTVTPPAKVEKYAEYKPGVLNKPQAKVPIKRKK
jgi:hypothetical protein